MAEPGLELLGTSGCHLCEQAETLLEQVGGYLRITWRSTDIATNAELLDRYGTRIPVLRLRARQGNAPELDWPFGLLDIVRLVRDAEGAVVESTRSSPSSGNPQ